MVGFWAMRVSLGLRWGGAWCFGRWARRLVAFVVAGAAGAVLASVVASGGVAPRAAVAHPAARPVNGALALGRLQSLPMAAQSVISPVLGSTEPGFAAVRSGLGYRLGGGGVLARLGARGVDLRAGGVSLSLTVVGLGRGGWLSRPGVVSVSAHANRVVYDRGLMREWYVAGPLGIEQGFTLARRPGGDGGPLSLALGLAGSVRAEQTRSRVRFLSRSGAVALRYGGLSVTDASGRQLRAALALHGATLLVRVWDRGARYPLRIDPLIQQGSKLSRHDETSGAYCGDFGWSVALSADGNTALIGGPRDNNFVGAAWVFTRSGSTWTQQGSKLTASGRDRDRRFRLERGAVRRRQHGPDRRPRRQRQRRGGVGVHALGLDLDPAGPKAHRHGESGAAQLHRFGTSVALSADGNTALIGGAHDNADVGAAWVFTRSGSTWTQQGPKLTASGEIGRRPSSAGAWRCRPTATRP